MTAPTAEEFLRQWKPTKWAVDHKGPKMQWAEKPLRALALHVKRRMSEQWTSVRCVFCDKSGHSVQFCPSTPTPPPQSFSEQQKKWCQSLIELKRVDVAVEYGRGVDWTSSVQRLNARALVLNEGNPFASSTAVRDRLRANAGWWKAAGADATVMSWILYGARLPAFERPMALSFENHPTCDEHIEFVDGEIATAVAEGLFVEMEESAARIVNPISVVPNKAGTKLRMCVDARWHNAHLPRVKFAGDGIEKDLEATVQKDDHMLTTDIARAYYSVPIVEEATPYLAVRHRGRVYAPTVLPFGSSIAPFVFTRITKQIVRLAHAIGVKVLNFYDDFLWAARAEQRMALTAFVKAIFAGTGWVLNDKCKWTPEMIAEFLGFIIDTKKMFVNVSDERIARAEALIKSLLQQKEIRIEELERLTGQIASMRPAIAVAQLWTRGLYRAINRVRDSAVTGFVELRSDEHEELMFWSENLRKRNGQQIISQAAMVEWFVDTSESAVGARSHDSKSQLIVPLPDALVGASSTARELFGVLTVVRHWGETERGRTVRICMDSYAAARNIANGGGGIERLSNLAKEIWAASEKAGITIRPQWVPREENTFADQLSKRWADWYRLNPKAVNTVQRMIARYDMKQKIPIVNVPFGQIQNAVAKAAADRATICIIHPRWTAQSWWIALQNYTRAREVLGTAEAVLVPRAQDPVAPPRWDLLASIAIFT